MEIKRKLEQQYSCQTKTDFKVKTVIRDKEVHYVMIKGATQEDITILNTNAPSIGAPQYIRQIQA